MAKREFSVVGKAARRFDAWAKAKGEATYLDDIRFEGMLWGKVLRSKHPHALILSIDISKAQKLPGVKTIITGADIPYLHGETIIDEPFLAQDRVRYRGDAVAAVAAVNEQIAADALRLIKVRYQKLPAILDPLEAMRPGALTIHPDLDAYARRPLAHPVKGTNICHHHEFTKGDIEKGFRESDFIFEDTFTTHMQQHCSIEPHAAICQVSSGGEITLWSNNDSPYRARRELAESLQLPFNRIRVISAPYIGGNFGGKGGLRAEAIAVALALKTKGRPVKVVYSREEEFTASLVRHPAIITMKTGVKKDGTLVARQVKLVLDSGAYTEKSPGVCAVAVKDSLGPYRIPHASVDAYVVYTNKQISGACRGFGGCQPAWAHESQMDMIASRLGVDPVAIRMKNSYREGDRHNTGQPLCEVSLQQTLEEAARLIDWGKRDSGRHRGRGLALLEKAGKFPSASAAFVKVEEDGTVQVLCSTTEVGQGAETIFCQIAAEELGVPLEMVSRAIPDTSVTPFDTSTTASRSTFHMGNAVLLAARDAKQQLLQLGAKVLEADPDDIRIEKGVIFSGKQPDISLTVKQVLTKRYGMHGTILGRGYYYHEDGTVPGLDPHMVNPYWVHFSQGAEVAVDVETGQIRLMKLVGVHDPGRAINPLICYGQIEGGMVMAMGYALSEQLLLDQGHTLNPSFTDYKIPRAQDVPVLVPVLKESVCEKGPWGAKSLGEPTTLGIAPAIANAVFAAVGVRITDLPLNPEKVYFAIKEKKTAAEKKK